MTLYADIPGERLDAFLARSVEGLTRSAAQKLLEEGCVLRCGKPGKKNDKLNPGEEITVHIPEPKAVDIAPTQMDLEIVYEDEDVLVINKPKGLVVHPAAGHQGIPSPASTASCARVSSTASIKIPPAFWRLPRMTLPM